MEQRFVKPAEGRLVRDPATGQPLPAEGALVEWTSFFRRRLAEGDIVEVEPEPAAPEPKAAPPQPRAAKAARPQAPALKETEQ